MPKGRFIEVGEEERGERDGGRGVWAQIPLLLLLQLLRAVGGVRVGL